MIGMPIVGVFGAFIAHSHPATLELHSTKEPGDWPGGAALTGCGCGCGSSLARA